MKKFIVVVFMLMFLFACSTVMAGQANFQWEDYSVTQPADAPYLHTTEAFEIQMGVVSGNYTATFKIPKLTNGVISTDYSVNIPAGKYYAVIRAKSTDGIYSDPSAEISSTIKMGGVGKFIFR